MFILYLQLWLHYINTEKTETSKKGLAAAVNTLKEEEANLLGVIVNKTDRDEYKRYRKDYDYFKKERFLQNAKSAEKKNKKNDDAMTADEYKRDFYWKRVFVTPAKKK